MSSPNPRIRPAGTLPFSSQATREPVGTGDTYLLRAGPRVASNYPLASVRPML